MAVDLPRRDCHPSCNAIGYSIMPRVSAVIPTFGRPALLKRAVETVLAQTMADLELIVVIDGHDPKTLDYVQGVTDPRVRYIAHDQQRGPGQARDTGAVAAKSEWVAFLDDDDEWLPQKLERQLAFAPPGARAVVMTQTRVVTPHGAFVRPLSIYDASRPIDEWLFDRTTWMKSGQTFFQPSSLMMPRALFDGLHFSTSRQHEDWELAIRALKEQGYTLLTVPEVLTIHYDDQRSSLSKERTWRHSLGWIDGLKPLITPRAYSGFLLNEIGRAAAEAGAYEALPALLAGSFRHGRPTARQLFRFGVTWAMPTRLRRRARSNGKDGTASDGQRETSISSSPAP
jgi:glycosyltransferase involved in cell wall biosynthesis